MPLTLRATKGAPLTTTELDENFNYLKGLIDGLGAGSAGVGVASIGQVGSQITFTMTDGSATTLTLPRALQGAAPVQNLTVTTHTPALSDERNYIRVAHASGCAVTVPNDATVNFDVNSEIHYVQSGTGQLTFTATLPAVINPVAGYQHKTAGQGSVIMLKKVAANQWDIIGALAEQT